MLRVTDRLATQLLRISRDPGSGRVRHPRALAIGLRSALLADLVLSGRIGEATSGPVIVASAEAPGDRILAAVLRTVERRPDVAWWRWHRHVQVDRRVLTDELVTAARWSPRRGAWGIPAYDDVDGDEALAVMASTLAVLESRRAPADASQAVLAVLAAMCGSIVGRPRPRTLRRELKPLVDAAAGSGETGAAMLPHVLGGAATLLKRPLRR